MARVAVMFPFRLEREHAGKDVFVIGQALARHGHEVELHCPTATEPGGWPLPVHAVGAAALTDAGYWHGVGADAALAFSFLRFARIVRAIAASGARVVIKGDTTGALVPRYQLASTLREHVYAPETARARIAGIAYWAATVGPLHRRSLGEICGALAAASAATVESDAARERLVRALTRAGRAPEAGRLVTVPSPVPELFLDGPVSVRRDRTVLALGRWDLPVKNAPLLARAFTRFAGERPSYELIVVGRGQQSGPLARAGVWDSRAAMPQRELVELYQRARIVVSSSHFESYSLSSHEALASGCTVVAPPLAPLEDVVAAGPYGTLASGWRPGALAAALAAEADAWDAGSRDPVATAQHWHERLDPHVIAGQYAELLGV